MHLWSEALSGPPLGAGFSVVLTLTLALTSTKWAGVMGRLMPKPDSKGRVVASDGLEMAADLSGSAKVGSLASELQGAYIGGKGKMTQERSGVAWQVRG